MKLKSSVLKISELSTENKQDLFQLMLEVYDGINWNKFLSDMNQKNYILILYNKDNAIAGFTTIQVFDFENKLIIYSGDTVIEEVSRGDIELMRAWWRFSYTIQEKNPAKQVFWLLISKGWRTYTSFPLYLKEIYPTYKCNTP